jgi:hypothetical protein
MIRPLCLLALAALAAPAAAGQPEIADRTLRPAPVEDDLQWAASVVQLNPLGRLGSGAKLFGLAGGDPAANGLHTFLAFYLSPADGWRLFEIGDFLSYRILSDRPGRVLIAIEESTMNADGATGSRRRRLELSWTPGGEGAPPETVSVRRLR